jgi:hypothetical protein
MENEKLRMGKNKKQLSSEIGKTCERFIIIKGEKNRFAK